MVQLDGKGGMVYGKLNITEETTYYLYIGKSGTYGGQTYFRGGEVTFAGGGSNYIDTSLFTDTKNEVGVNSGDGYIYIISIEESDIQ